jgi:hypothetical protein
MRRVGKSLKKMRGELRLFTGNQDRKRVVAEKSVCVTSELRGDWPLQLATPVQTSATVLMWVANWYGRRLVGRLYEAPRRPVRAAYRSDAIATKPHDAVTAHQSAAEPIGALPIEGATHRSGEDRGFGEFVRSAPTLRIQTPTCYVTFHRGASSLRPVALLRVPGVWQSSRVPCGR